MPDVSENYSSLREAVNRILGTPPGGNATTAGTGQGGVQTAPRALTDVSVTNSPILFDPFAEQNAALASVKAENARLSAQAAQVAAAPVATTAPAAAAPVAAAPPALWKTYNEYFAGKPGSSEEYNKYRSTLPQQYNDLINYGIDPSMVRSGMAHSIFAGDKFIPIIGAEYYQKGNPVFEANVANYAKATTAAAAPPPALVKPVNPGPRAPWQASQQYWKDLAAYQKAGGK